MKTSLSRLEVCVRLVCSTEPGARMEIKVDKGRIVIAAIDGDGSEIESVSSPSLEESIGKFHAAIGDGYLKNIREAIRAWDSVANEEVDP